MEQFILIHLAFKYDYYINNIIETNKMIKIPENKIRQKHGVDYYNQLKHIINIRNLYNIHIDRTLINKLYSIKQYNKS